MYLISYHLSWQYADQRPAIQPRRTYRSGKRWSRIQLSKSARSCSTRSGVSYSCAQRFVHTYGGPQFQVTQDVMNRFAEAIEKAGVNVVPQVVVGGGSGNGTSSGGNLMEGLLAMLLSERMGVQVNSNGGGNASRPEVAAMRDQIMQRLMAEQPKEAPMMPATVSTTPLKPNGAN